MERKSFGLYVMSTSCNILFGLLALGVCIPSHGTPPPAEPEPVVAAGAEAAYQVEVTGGQPDWRLDTAIFTDISPVSVPEIAIKLPEDQRDGH